MCRVGERKWKFVSLMFDSSAFHLHRTRRGGTTQLRTPRRAPSANVQTWIHLFILDPENSKQS